MCDERSSCSDYVQERTWSCFCGEEEAPKSECNEPDEILTFTCPATESCKLFYEIFKEVLENFIFYFTGLHSALLRP